MRCVGYAQQCTAFLGCAALGLGAWLVMLWCSFMVHPLGCAVLWGALLSAWTLHPHPLGAVGQHLPLKPCTLCPTPWGGLMVNSPHGGGSLPQGSQGLWSQSIVRVTSHYLRLTTTMLDSYRTPLSCCQDPITSISILKMLGG